MSPPKRFAQSWRCRWCATFGEFKEFIDNEMIVILGQMDSPTEIFDHVYLGSEWNASNLEELQNSGVRYILNVTREIDNFFPGMFEYHNIRVCTTRRPPTCWEYWNDTYKFITKAKKAGAKCLVHCKMVCESLCLHGDSLRHEGVRLGPREGLRLRQGASHRHQAQPLFHEAAGGVPGYILLASKQRHNKLWRSHSDSDLSERHESLLCKTGPHSHTLGLSDPHNNNNGPSPSLQHFLLQALGAANDPDNKTSGSHISDTHSEPVRLTPLPLPLPGAHQPPTVCVTPRRTARTPFSRRGRPRWCPRREWTTQLWWLWP
ncbi:hypothetical protein J4Q44_G00334750 [Coregonus suidteri]|uniref:Tyrosine-protein phosphatase domain-containing protein n=1 Tax=Coregonus suidteri TaxID=861788 RepID=A0AAN8QN16_9TELE